jgi:hypothetical protein
MCALCLLVRGNNSKVSCECAPLFASENINCVCIVCTRACEHVCEPSSRFFCLDWFALLSYAPAGGRMHFGQDVRITGCAASHRFLVAQFSPYHTQRPPAGLAYSAFSSAAMLPR